MSDTINNSNSGREPTIFQHIEEEKNGIEMQGYQAVINGNIVGGYAVFHLTEKL